MKNTLEQNIPFPEEYIDDNKDLARTADENESLSDEMANVEGKGSIYESDASKSSFDGPGNSPST